MQLFDFSVTYAGCSTQLYYNLEKWQVEKVLESRDMTSQNMRLIPGFSLLHTALRTNFATSYLSLKPTLA